MVNCSVEDEVISIFPFLSSMRCVCDVCRQYLNNNAVYFLLQRTLCLECLTQKREKMCSVPVLRQIWLLLMMVNLDVLSLKQ